MIGRRAATVAGKRLNAMAEMIAQPTVDGLRVGHIASRREVQEMTEAVRVANEIIYQYYCIPRSVREEWYRGGDLSGISMQDLVEV